ncbi:MAG: UvrD-helicase domain-containing protein [Deltaproteobacteria bacterium]|nr:UvrD-helicase domain-containing protein [Deltaproteobacteria bacterium]
MTRETADRLIDADARELIATDLDSNMLVEAAAGTGKTHSMASRMVALVASGRVRIRTLAAVTFTRKAAAELKSRFEVAVEKAARAADGEERVRLLEARDRLDQCFVGTIHAFCARLLRERPVEAGVDPAFEEIEKDADAALREEAFELFADGLFAADPDGLLTRLDDLGIALAELKKPFVAFAGHKDVEEWPTGAGAAADLARTADAVRDYGRHILELLPALPEETGSDELMPRYRKIVRLLRHLDLSSVVELAEVLALMERLPKVTQKCWPTRDLAKQEAARFTAFAASVAAPGIASIRVQRHAPVMEALHRAQAISDRLRHDRGLVGFADLLLGAARLLRDKPHVREDLGARFTHLLVDEFQDTDPVQAEVMLLITADDPRETDWRRCVPRPGSLFVVGDPKQSIYRFRRADIATYGAVKRIVAAHGRVLALSTSFRSGRDIIAFVNRAFEGAFPAAATEESPAYVALEPAPGAGAGVVRVLTCDGNGHGEDIAIAEADRIARTIRARLDAGECASASDFMIVTMRRRRLSVYAQALGRYGVPCRVTGGAPLSESGELRLLGKGLAAAADPGNPVALVAALRSELFGVSDAALYALKKGGGAFDFTKPLPAALVARDPSAHAAFRDAFAVLGDAARALDELPLPLAAHRVAARLGLFARAVAGEGGDARAGSLAKAVEILREAGREAWCPAELAERLFALAAGDEDHDGLLARGDAGPSVEIMNLHQVKGLEAKVVFLADPTGKWEPKATLHVDRSDGRTRGYMVLERPHGPHGSERICEPPDWDAHAARESVFLEAERTRLLYVAATRAAAELVVTRRIGGERWNPWQFFEPLLAGAAELPDPGPQSPAAPTKRRVEAKEISRTAEAAGEALVACAVPSWGTAAAKALALRDEGDREWEGGYGAGWGAVIHALLDLAMRAPDADLETAARATLEAEDMDPGLAARAAAAAHAVSGSKIWRRAVASPRCLTEVPFELLLDDGPGAGKPTLVRGSIDLAFEDDGGFVIVDYKTDRAAARALDKLAEHYAPQVRLYARCFERITGRKVKERGLYFLEPDAYVTVDAGREGKRVK